MTTTTVVVSRINLIIVEISSLQTPPQDFALSTIPDTRNPNIIGE